MKRLKLFLCLIWVSTFSFSQDLEKERARWNKNLTKDSTYLFSKQPNALLVEVVKNLKPGVALDVGMGQGRNSLYLARKGWKVTGIDIADEAVEYAKKQAEKEKLKINAIISSLENFDFGTSRWDLITYIYEGCLDVDLLKKMKISLRPNGVIAFEFFHREAGIKMNRPTFGCEANAISKSFQRVGGFNITKYEEKDGIADFGLAEFKLVRLVAVKK